MNNIYKHEHLWYEKFNNKLHNTYYSNYNYCQLLTLIISIGTNINTVPTV